MAKVRAIESPEEEKEGKKRYAIFCPGCKCAHVFRTGPGEWSFNGDMEKPTIAPSLLVTQPGIPEYRCHSFVNDGTIRFLEDSKHDLKGRAVPLEDF